MAYLQNLNENGVALQGYDPVSYHSGQPLLGSDTITASYAGAIYHFQNEVNQKKFEADPLKFIPQYGGFCAVAISEGKTFPIEPNTYILDDGKLYLFYNGKLGNTKPDWEKDTQMRRSNADDYWTKQNLNVVYPSLDY